MGELKETLLERWFGMHFQSVCDRLGKDKAKEYARAVEGRLRSVLIILCLSVFLLFFLLLGFDTLRTKTQLQALIIVVLLIILVLLHIFDMRKGAKEVVYDKELTRNWKLISFSACGIGVLCVSWALYALYPVFSLSSDDIEKAPGQVDCAELGIKVHIPDGWSDVQWKYKSDESAQRPQYWFWVARPERTMVFDIHGWSTPPRYEIDNFMSTAMRSSRNFCDRSLIELPNLVDVGGRRVFRYIGTRKDSPDFIYVVFIDLHCCSMIFYTYSFKSHLPYKEELAAAEEIYGMIGFEEVKVPLYETVEDAPADDYSVGDDFVDIKSAKMKMMTPGQLEWDTRTRTIYNFNCPMGSYDVSFDVKVVYTADSATLEEFTKYLEEDMVAFMNGGFIISPSLVKLDNITAFRAVGKCRSDRDNVNVQYLMLHKGALLTVSAAIPSSLPLDENINAIEEVIEQIQFY